MDYISGLIVFGFIILLMFVIVYLSDKILQLEIRVKKLEDFINRMYKYNG